MILPPVLLILIPGLSWVMSSERLFASFRKALLVKVSLTETRGTMEIFDAIPGAACSCANAAAEHNANTQVTRPPWTPHDKWSGSQANGGVLCPGIMTTLDTAYSGFLLP